MNLRLAPAPPVDFPDRAIPVPGRGGRILRNLDKYAGIPLIFCLGMLRRPRRLPNTIRRIGVLSTAAIGDTILLSAPLADLRSAFQNAEICLLAGPSNYEAGCLLGLADKVVRLPVFDPVSSISDIRRHDFDLLLDFGPWPRLNAIFATLSGARFVAGFRTGGQYRHYAYDLAVDHLGDVHELDNYRSLLAGLAIPSRHRPCVSRARIPPVADVQCHKPYLVFHLWPGGAGANVKQWPTERWLALTEHFIEQGYHIVFTGGPSQKSANDCVIEAISPARRRFIRNHAGLSLAATAAVMLESALVVSVDTGAMHLAAALEVPLVALMGPASPRRWGPIGTAVSVLQSPLSECGYLNLGFEIPDHPPRCMESIPFDAVCAKCEEALQPVTMPLRYAPVSADSAPR